MERRATLGVMPHMTDETMQILDIAGLAVERGFDSLFLCEHTCIPVEGASVSPRGVLPEWTKRIPDPYISLAAVAAATDLEIGTAVGLAAEYDPISHAKKLATLDQLSGGRFVYGVGWGWHREEFEACTGVSAKERVPVLREKLDAMRRIWSDDEAEYHGRYVDVPKTWSWPKPARPGGPPILLGVPGNERNFRRIVEWADGWIPMGGALLGDESLPAHIGELQRMWADAGRDPEALDITVTQGPTRRGDVRAALERADELGVRRILISVVTEEMARIEEHLDAAALAPADR